MERIIRFSVLVIASMIVIVAVNTSIQLRMNYFNNPNTATHVSTVAEREAQLNCLAINIYREAGNEPFEGKVGVAQVTINRANNKQFPNDICKVVYQKNIFMEKVVCQFSWYCDGKQANRPVNKAQYTESMAVAKKVLLEDFKLDSLKDVLYYHADYVSPNWRKEQIGKIGRHIFYKD